MSDNLNIKRYRLTYGGGHDAELRRWKLRPVCERGGASAGVPIRSSESAPQRNVAMYATPART